MSSSSFFRLFSLTALPSLGFSAEVRLRDSHITAPAQLDASLSSALNALPTAFANEYVSILNAIQPSATPDSVPQATATLLSIYSAYPAKPVEQAAHVLLNGLAGDKTVESLLPGYDCDNPSNQNLKEPSRPVYPSKSPTDAPYDFTEEDLRQAIYIPSEFQFGEGKDPLIFIPGTGLTGCETYTPTYAKVLKQSAYADPVFLNVPTRMLDDEQNNAEFVAYAINYISGISGGSNVSIMAYSGGNTATHWALKYWPSTRGIVSDYLTISPDYHGTTLDFEICLPGAPCPPSVLQQAYESVFVQTLLNNGGDSAYVPTTASWSTFDENVEPQQGTNASAYLNDAHAVGSTHNQIQSTCSALTPAGLPLPGHEGALYNSEAFAVNLDALQNPGPGNIARSGAANTCGNLTGPGLGLEAILGAEALQVIALYEVNAYQHKVVTEPPIKKYAQNDMPTSF